MGQPLGSQVSECGQIEQGGGQSSQPGVRPQPAQPRRLATGPGSPTVHSARPTVLGLTSTRLSHTRPSSLSTDGGQTTRLIWPSQRHARKGCDVKGVPSSPVGTSQQLGGQEQAGVLLPYCTMPMGGTTPRAGAGERRREVWGPWESCTVGHASFTPTPRGLSLRWTRAP